ncbi:hypothetical protein NP493_4026g00000 [Ridgeia piscesae]|uniref:Uncharacterized protein n=1 Tax=Ridgeia piscesae TaxID=27915 RepID=A0AAD9J215_RIDPI|nr:hypothetical protein NP493_4026g00000 [Ridgeia piscesae]
MVSAYSNNLNSVWPLKNANYFLVTFVERLTISYQDCSISTTSIGHQTKYVVSLTVSMCLIKQRTQRSQRYVVLLRKHCLDEVKVDGKTQYLPIVPKSADAIVDKSVIRVGEATITASLCVQCLGVCIDRHLVMKKQVSQTISACSFYLRNINQISRFLTRPTKERVVNAIITSRLDYCNALSYIARLQRIQHMAARSIMRSPRSDSATPLQRELHWLPIVCRVDFKLLVFTYKAMHNDAPMYLCELVCPYQSTRTLRPANNNMLEVKRTRTKAGDCSFAVAAASLCNNLPTVIKTCDNLTSYKRLLKTHFFRIAY